MFTHPRPQPGAPPASGQGNGAVPMHAMPPQANVVARIPELLEALRAEYEGIQQEFNYLKHQREDVDSKRITIFPNNLFYLVVVHDITMIQKILYDLEKNHLRMKQQYVIFQRVVLLS